MHIPEPKKLSYNARCREATLLVDKMIAARSSVSNIKVACLRRLGVGSLFVDKYLKLLSDSGEVTLVNGELEYE